MILGVGTFDPSGGLKTVTESYVNSFRLAGIPFHWLLFGSVPIPVDRKPDSTYIFLEDGWRYYSDSAAIDLQVRSSVRGIIQRLNPDLIFRPLQFSYEPYLESIDVPYIPVVQLLVSALLESGRRQSYAADSVVAGGFEADEVRLKFERRFYSGAAALITNSKITAADLDRFYPEAAAKNALCSPPGAAEIFAGAAPLDVCKRVLFFGRLSHQKGIPLLLKHVPEGWSLTVMGQGKWSAADFHKYGIEFLAWREGPALFQSLEQSAFCVFPSHYEPWGLSLNEALAAGRICIAQKGAGGHEAQIVHGENGFLYDFNSGSFWSFLGEVFSLGKTRLLEISTRARDSARSWNDHFNEVEGFFTSINQRKG